MRAKITRVSGDEVYIERVDGLSTRVAISIFSKDDQTYIREWEKDEILKNGAIEMRFGVDETQKNRYSSGGIKYKKYNAGYEITLKNTTMLNIENIRVEYRIKKFEDQLGAAKRSSGRYLWKKDVIKVNQLPPRQEKRLNTEKFPMTETDLEDGYYWAGAEGKNKSKDKLEGIWVKVFVDDQLILEDSRPLNMMRTTSWNNPEGN